MDSNSFIYTETAMPRCCTGPWTLRDQALTRTLTLVSALFLSALFLAGCHLAFPFPQADPDRQRSTEDQGTPLSDALRQGDGEVVLTDGRAKKDRPLAPSDHSLDGLTDTLAPPLDLSVDVSYFPDQLQTTDTWPRDMTPADVTPGDSRPWDLNGPDADGPDASGPDAGVDCSNVNNWYGGPIAGGCNES